MARETPSPTGSASASPAAIPTFTTEQLCEPVRLQAEQTTSLPEIVELIEVNGDCFSEKELLRARQDVSGTAGGGMALSPEELDALADEADAQEAGDDAAQRAEATAFLTSSGVQDALETMGAKYDIALLCGDGVAAGHGRSSQSCYTDAVVTVGRAVEGVLNPSSPNLPELLVPALMDLQQAYQLLSEAHGQVYDGLGSCPCDFLPQGRMTLQAKNQHRAAVDALFLDLGLDAPHYPTDEQDKSAHWDSPDVP